MSRPLTNYVADDLEAQACHEADLSPEEREDARRIAQAFEQTVIGAMAEAANRQEPVYEDGAA